MNSRQIIAENDGAFYFLVFDHSESWDYFIDMLEAYNLADTAKWSVSLPNYSTREKILSKAVSITLSDLKYVDISLKKANTTKDLRLVITDFTNKFRIFNNFSEEGEA